MAGIGTERKLGYSEAEALQVNTGQMIPRCRVPRGAPMDITVTATALKDESGRPVAIVGTKRVIARRKELKGEVLEIASLEQRRIGQDLHDTVSQELTALKMAAGDMAETLQTKPSDGVKLVEQTFQGLQFSQKELREVLPGQILVAVETEGLIAAS